MVQIQCCLKTTLSVFRTASIILNTDFIDNVKMAIDLTNPVKCIFVPQNSIYFVVQMECHCENPNINIDELWSYIFYALLCLLFLSFNLSR